MDQGINNLPEESPDPLMDGTNLKPQGVHIQTMSLEEASNYPAIKNLEARIQQILALTAFGFSPKTIGKAWGVRSNTIKEALKKYDPENKFTISRQAKRAFLTKMLESRAAEALAYITPEKLEASNAFALASIAEKMLKTITAMEPRDSTKIMVGTVDDIMKKLKQKPIELVRGTDGSYREASDTDADDSDDEEHKEPKERTDA